MKEHAACGSERPGALENVGLSASATAAKTGGRSRASTSARRRAAKAGSAGNAAPVAPGSKTLNVDGWVCRDFAGQTGHALGRCAQLGDLQIHVTCGDELVAPDVPLPVLRWLLGVERS